jgi:hypothetical protein
MDELLVAFVFVVAFSLFGYGVYLALTASVDTSYEGTATPPASSDPHPPTTVPIPSGTDLPSHQVRTYPPIRGVSI